jgi:Fe2+ or Zn2+ uptake regulation protein
MINRAFQDGRRSRFILAKEDNHEHFNCACGGKVTMINQNTASHKCESIFANHQDLPESIYERVQINPKLTNGEIKYNWFLKWDN